LNGDLVFTSLSWEYVVPLSVGGNLGEPTLCFLYAALVCASTSFELRIANRAQKSKILRSVIAVVSVDAVQNRLDFLAVPNKRIGVEETQWIITPLRQRRVLFLTPPEVMPPNGPLGCTPEAVAQYLTLSAAFS
jgi:hypothetical protein